MISIAIPFLLNPPYLPEAMNLLIIIIKIIIIIIILTALINNYK